MRKPILLIAALAAAPALAQTARDERTQQAQGGAGTGRTEQSTGISGTAGSRAEVKNAEAFIQQAAASDMFELQSSRLAMERSQNQQLRDFAQEMAKDHAKTTSELRDLMQRQPALRGIRMPEGLDQQRQRWLDQLKNASGADFDALFSQQQMQAHLLAVDLFRNYSQAGDDPQLKQWASATLPTLQQHLQKVQALRSGG